MLFCSVVKSKENIKENLVRFFMYAKENLSNEQRPQCNKGLRRREGGGVVASYIKRIKGTYFDVCIDVKIVN